MNHDRPEPAHNLNAMRPVLRDGIANTPSVVVPLVDPEGYDIFVTTHFLCTMRLEADYINR